MDKLTNNFSVRKISEEDIPEVFIEALEREDMDAIHKCPKADLHNHFVLGGSRRYLKEQTG